MREVLGILHITTIRQQSVTFGKSLRKDPQTNEIAGLMGCISGTAL